MRAKVPTWVFYAATLAVIALSIVGTVQLVAGDSTQRTVTVERGVPVPGPQQTMTVIQQVNPPMLPPRGAPRGAVPPRVASVTMKGPWPGYTVWFAAWPSVVGAVRYVLWVDLKNTGEQAATPGATQGITIPVRCGVKHTFNLQPKNAAGEVGAKLSAAKTFTPKAC